VGASHDRRRPAIVINTGTVLVNGPDHRFASALEHFGSVNLRIGWNATDRLQLFGQAGLAVGAFRSGTGLAEPAGRLWREQTSARTGPAVGLGAEFQTSSRVVLGSQFGLVRFSEAKGWASESSGRYVALSRSRVQHGFARLSVGYRF
jgi:opacity protein-like surface antigen